MSFRVYY